MVLSEDDSFDLLASFRIIRKGDVLLNPFCYRCLVPTMIVIEQLG